MAAIPRERMTPPMKLGRSKDLSCLGAGVLDGGAFVVVVFGCWVGLGLVGGTVLVGGDGGVVVGVRVVGFIVGAGVVAFGVVDFGWSVVVSDPFPGFVPAFWSTTEAGLVTGVFVSLPEPAVLFVIGSAWVRSAGFPEQSNENKMIDVKHTRKVNRW